MAWFSGSGYWLGRLVLERGVAVDFAPHDVLLERCDIYRHLWHQQNRHIQ